MSGLFHSYENLPDTDDEVRRDAALEHVKDILLMHGATEEEIDHAVADGVIDLFVAERMLVPSRRRYTRSEVAELTGVDVDKLERFWRSLGFADVDDDDRALTDLDLEAVRIFQGMQALGAAETDTALQMARVIGSSMARIAEAELVPGNSDQRGGGPGDLDAEAFASIADETIPAMARLLEFVWRRQVAGRYSAQHDAAQPRAVAGPEPGPGRGFRRHGGVHPAQPAPRRRGAGRRGAAVRGDLPRHRVGRRGPGGQDDRRRGHVRGGPRRRRGADRTQTLPTPTPTTTSCPTCGSGWPAVPCCCATATTSGPPSTWPTGSSTSETPGPC